jgi:hypothetical protein
MGVAEAADIHSGTIDQPSMFASVEGTDTDSLHCHWATESHNQAESLQKSLRIGNQASCRDGKEQLPCLHMYLSGAQVTTSTVNRHSGRCMHEGSQPWLNVPTTADYLYNINLLHGRLLAFDINMSNDGCVRRVHLRPPCRLSD